MSAKELTELIERTLEEHDWFDANGEDLEKVAHEITAKLKSLQEDSEKLLLAIKALDWYSFFENGQQFVALETLYKIREVEWPPST